MYGSDRERAEFDDWVGMWDRASKKMGETVPEQRSDFGFFGTDTVDMSVDDPTKEEALIWERLNDHMNETMEEWYGLCEGNGSPGKSDFDVAMAKPYDHSYRFNPNTFSTKGADASPAPHLPARVTPNFTDGERLIRLAELNDLIHHLEAMHWRAVIEGQDRKAKKIKSELDASIQEREKLGSTLVPHPELDLA